MLSGQRIDGQRGNAHHLFCTLQEIDELVDEWSPEPLAQPLTAIEQADLAAVPIVAGPNGPKPKLVSTGKTATNLTSFNFTGLAGNEHIKQKAVETLRKYGLGSCGPPGFYGTLGTFLLLVFLILVLSFACRRTYRLGA